MDDRDRKVSLEELRRAVELFKHPVCATLDSMLVATNEAMLRLSGYAREELLGKHFEALVPAEERRWLVDVEERRSKGEALPDLDFAMVKARSGEVLPLQISVSRVPTEDGRFYALCSCNVAFEHKQELEFAEQLAGVSTLLITQLSHEEIRNTAVQAFERSKLWAGFYAATKEVLTPLALSGGTAPASPDPRYAIDALREHRPIFSAGPSGSEAEAVYLPVRHAGGQEVLVLRGGVNPRARGALRLFGEQLAHAYANATLISYLETGHREMGLLLQLARTTSQSLETASILDVAADFAVQLLEAKYCFICLSDESGRTLQARAASTSVRDQMPVGVKFEPGKGTVVGRVAEERAPVVIHDIEDEAPDVAYSSSLASRYGARSALGVPMISRGQLIGVMVLGDARPRHFGLQQVELAQATAWQLSLSVANARLYESLMESYVVLHDTRAAMVKSERLAALGELSAIVAHEVRNPLGVIFNAVSSLRRLVQGGEPGVLLDILAEESVRLNRLVGELLDFARPRAPAMQAENVGRVIQDALEAAQSDPGLAGLQLSMQTDVEAGLPPVPMDARQIRQALVNVAVNALQSMPRGGTLRVKARRDGGSKEKPLLCIDVQDDGPGISAEVLPRIFEPFFTTKAKGTGLGLAVVKRIIEDHQGTLEVRSEQGRGTTFTFRLPM